MRLLRLIVLAAALAIASLLFTPSGLEARPSSLVAVFEPDGGDLSRVPLPNDLLRAGGRNHLPGSTGAVQSVNQVRGFSTAGPIYIPFSGTIDPRTVDERSVVLLDARGNRADVDRAVVTYEHGQSSIKLDPVRPLAAAATHYVFVTDAVRGTDGAAARPSAFLVSMMQSRPFESPQTEARRRAYAQVWQVAGKARLPRTRLVQAFQFTTQPIGQVLPVLRKRVQDMTPAFTVSEKAESAADVQAIFDKLGAGKAAHGHVGLVYKGTYTAPRYVADGSTTPIRFDPRNMPIQIGTVEVPFLVTIPAGASGPVPAIVYSHGSYRDMTDLLWLADEAAAEGFAVIGLDAELHGLRAAVVDGVRQHSGTNLVNLDHPIMLRDNWYQTCSDQYALIHMIRAGATRFGGAAPLLSTERVGYVGHSMGSCLGGVMCATEPGINAASLAVGGGKVHRLLLLSGWFSPRVNAELARRGIRPVTPQYHAWFTMFQTVLDDVDPFNYGPIFTSLATPPSVLSQEMAGEDVMPNVCTESMALAMGLTQVHPVRPVRGMRQAGWPFHGSALFQFPGGGHNTIINAGEGPTAAVHAQALRYIKSARKGGATVVCPDIPIPDLHINMSKAPGQ